LNTVTALNFGSVLQRFFVERLMQQRHASTRTLTAYRDAFKLLLAYLEKTLKKRSARITLEDLSAPLILGFLNHLEHTRHNSIRTRNARFAAIRSFLHYTGSQHPTALALAQPVLAISMTRFERPLVGSLSREEVQAILEAPNPKTWIGQRDRVMLTTLYNSGARVSELTALRVTDVSFGTVAAVQILGKGRKQRQVPLWPATARLLKRWLRSYPRTPEQPLFTNRSGHALTRMAWHVVSSSRQRALRKNIRNWLNDASSHTFFDTRSPSTWKRAFDSDRVNKRTEPTARCGRDSCRTRRPT
jgi:integrase/recombinase XerD